MPTSRIRSSRPAPPARRAAVAILALWLPVAAGVPPLRAAAPPAERGRHGMVVAPEARAAEVGRDVLRAGGNAVDAAVAVAFALDVTYPLAAGVGGGGFFLVRGPDGTHHALDFRETAPAALRPEAFLDAEGRPLPDRSLLSGLAVGIPGTVAGLADAHRRWGSRPWAELLRPAVALARDGIPVYPYLAHTLAERAGHVTRHAATRAVFAPRDTVLRAGERLVQPDLARTLDRIARLGADGFYRGPVAEAIVATVREAGGVMDAGDLAGYEPRLREPLETSYRGHRVVTFPPPSGGGLALLQTLELIEPFDLTAAGWGSSAAVHRIVEAERRAFADRSRWAGDPDHVAVPVAALLDADYLATRAAGIRADSATPSAGLAPEMPPAPTPAETLHFSVADAAGGAVAATITLNGWYGTGRIAAGTGVLLNNELDDFALAPGVPNQYGLTGGAANAVAPGRRPASSMAPTIVEPRGGGPRPLLVLGSPGGSRIVSAVLGVLVNVIDFGLPLQDAVNAPRFHHQWLPDTIVAEPRALPADVAAALVARGHTVELAETPLGNVNAIGLAPDGAWLGAPDPRRHGAAAGY